MLVGFLNKANTEFEKHYLLLLLETLKCQKKPKSMKNQLSFQMSQHMCVKEKRETFSEAIEIGLRANYLNSLI